MKIVRIAVLVVICLVLAALGGLLGAYLGGNFAVGVRLFGVRGYEALGLVGFFLGGAGGLLAVRNFWR